MTTLSETTDPMEARIDGAFAAFDGVMGALAVPTDHGGTIPTAYRVWQGLEHARAVLDRQAEQTAGVIEGIQKDTDPRLTPDVKAALISDQAYLFDVKKAEVERDMKDHMGALKSELGGLFASKVVEAPSADRHLIRQEIEQTIAANPKQTRTAVLAGLVQQDPARYGPEIASAFGKNLMALANESEVYGALVRHAQNLVPDTKVSGHARAALQALERTQIEGMIGGISWKAAQRVEAAKAPKAPERGVYRPDTIRAPRS